MPTLDDLRSALGHLAEQAAPGCEEATAERIRHRRARRRGTAAAVAVAVAAALALTVAPLVATHRTTPTATPVASRSGPAIISALAPTRYVFDIMPGTGYVAYDSFTSATSQAISLYSAAGRLYATVVVFSPGVPAPARPTDATDVVVNDGVGFYGTLTLDLDYHREDATLPGALAWQYQPGAWAVVYGPVREEPQEPPVTILTAEQARQVVGWVRPGRYHAATVPARFSGFPGDLVIKGVVHRRVIGSDDPGRRDGLIGLGPRGSATATLWINVTAASADVCAEFGEPVTIGGYTGGYLQTMDRLTVCDQRTYVSIDASFAVDAMPLDQLKELVRSMTPAPGLDTPTTWFDATTAIS